MKISGNLWKYFSFFEWMITMLGMEWFIEIILDHYFKCLIQMLYFLVNKDF